MVPEGLFQQTAVSAVYLLKATVPSSHQHFNWKQIRFGLLLVASLEAQASLLPISCSVVFLAPMQGKP